MSKGVENMLMKWRGEAKGGYAEKGGVAELKLLKRGRGIRLTFGVRSVLVALESCLSLLVFSRSVFGLPRFPHPHHAFFLGFQRCDYKIVFGERQILPV